MLVTTVSLSRTGYRLEVASAPLRAVVRLRWFAPLTADEVSARFPESLIDLE